MDLRHIRNRIPFTSSSFVICLVVLEAIPLQLTNKNGTQQILDEFTEVEVQPPSCVFKLVKFIYFDH